jgi:hypothetical protein
MSLFKIDFHQQTYQEDVGVGTFPLEADGAIVDLSSLQVA